MKTLFLLSACLLMAACTGRSSQASNDDEAKPVITVTLEPQRYFTEAIAGDKFKVVSMVPIGFRAGTFGDHADYFEFISGSILLNTLSLVLDNPLSKVSFFSFEKKLKNPIFTLVCIIHLLQRYNKGLEK